MPSALRNDLSLENVPFKAPHSKSGPAIGRDDARAKTAVRQPPFNLCDERGAIWLAQQLKAYWAAQGHEIEVKCVTGRYSVSLRRGHVDVRSNLVNGLPA